MATTASNTPKYAFDRAGKVRFRKDREGNEQYLRVGRTDHVDTLATMDSAKIRYARLSDGSEIYPRREVTYRDERDGQEKTAVVEFQLGDLGHAKRKIPGGSGAVEYYHPLGLDGSEYFLKDSNTMPEDYPIDKNGYYMIAVKRGLRRNQGEVKFLSRLSSPAHKEISELKNKKSLPKVLVLPDLHYFATTIKAGREPRALDGDDVPVDSKTTDVAEVEKNEKGDDENVQIPPAAPVPKDDDGTDNGTDDGTDDGIGDESADEESAVEKDVQTRPAVPVSANVFSFGYVAIAFVFVLISTVAFFFWKRQF